MANAVDSRSNWMGSCAVHTHHVPGQETLLTLSRTPPQCINVGTSKFNAGVTPAMD